MRNLFVKSDLSWRILVLFVVVFLVLFVSVIIMLGQRVKYDDSIVGSAYQDVAMVIPRPEPAPFPEDKEPVQQRYAGDLVSIYNDFTYKTAYLTFDDGPTTNITPQILDILKEKGVHATFFILGKNAERYPELIQRIAAEGHTIANHGFSHDYKYIYKNAKNFMADVEAAERTIFNTGGGSAYVKVFRFPGGSFERKKNPQKWALYEAGYSYLDWNALSGDAERHNVPAAEQLEYVKETVRGRQNAVILMHDADTKQTTVDALSGIIDYLRQEGFILRGLGDVLVP